jgi:hypothetical protein
MNQTGLTLIFTSNYANSGLDFIATYKHNLSSMSFHVTHAVKWLNHAVLEITYGELSK